MATSLPNDVELTYNGITFPVYTETQSITGTPVYDAANRTVTHVVWNMIIKSVFSVSGQGDGADVGDEMEQLRRALTKPGGKLVYANNGFGSFSINTTNADVKWGPKPKMLQWKGTPGTNTITIVWQVEVAIAECSTGGTGIPIGSPRPPLEYCYQVNYALDASGYTTKTISGHVAVATTRRTVNDRTLSDHADRLREAISPPCPPRFRPTARSFTLSEDKCRLSFSFTFEQLPPNVPPEGCIRVSATHSAESGNLALVKWQGTIQATYEMAYHVHRKESLTHFLALVKDRLDQANRLRQRQQPGGNIWAGALQAVARLRGLVIPTRLSISESLYDRESASYSLSYMTTLDRSDLVRAVEVLGFFRPAPQSDWHRWYATLRNRGEPLHPRGVAQHRFDPKEDRIIDLCLGLDGGQPIVVSPTQVEGGKPPQGQGDDLTPHKLFQQINIAGAELGTENSWLDYRNTLQVEQGDEQIEQQLLPTQEIKTLKGAQASLDAAGGGYRVPYTNAPSSLIQKRGKPALAIVLAGRAARAGYAIAPPEVFKIGGVEAVAANRAGIEFFRTEVTTSSAYPICIASWRLRWILPEIPTGTLSPPPNPMDGEVITGRRAEFAGLAGI